MPRKPNKSTRALREWRIALVRTKGQYLGRVEAQDAEAAIKAAIEQFHARSSGARHKSTQHKCKSKSKSKYLRSSVDDRKTPAFDELVRIGANGNDERC